MRCPKMVLPKNSMQHGQLIWTEPSCQYSKRPLKNSQNKGLNGRWLLNEGRKYCRMSILQYF